MIRLLATTVFGLGLAVLLPGAAVHAQAQRAPGGDEPALPAGLEESPKPKGEPNLPAGLEESPGGEPDLPTGLEGPTATRPAKKEPNKPVSFLDAMKDLGFSGFVEARGGVRTQRDHYEDQASIGEARLQLEWERVFKDVRFKVTGDVVYDQVDPERGHVDLVKGTGWFDLREAWTSFSPVSWMDVKLGRQVLTWGTGNLLFVNDLFPKDWQSFFVGRDLEYLKAPSDALKLSVFSGLADVDLVYVPRANPSRFISGRRISYYSSMLGRRAGQDAVIRTEDRDEWFDDSEWAGRISRKLGSYELAAYGYWGFWKTPEGFDPLRNLATYPRLNAYGGSIRGPLPRGIVRVEGAYYDSSQDRQGDRPFVRNSEVRLLAGYETDLPEIAPELNLDVQYYVELMCHYDEYVRSLPAGVPARDRGRHVVTIGLTKKLMNQNLTVGLFSYYSPTDGDAYLRPKVAYKIDDHWTVEVGGNVFFGRSRHTFFAQFARDTNVYASVRYGF